MNAEELQREIKKLIDEMGWTQAEAARRVYCELNESDDVDELRRYVEVFKKRLNRPSTAPDHLRIIFKALCEQREVQQLRTIKPTYIPGATLDPELQREMRRISRAFDRDVEENG